MAPEFVEITSEGDCGPRQGFKKLTVILQALPRLKREQVVLEENTSGIELGITLTDVTAICGSNDVTERLRDFCVPRMLVPKSSCCGVIARQPRTLSKPRCWTSIEDPFSSTMTTLSVLVHAATLTITVTLIGGYPPVEVG